MATVPTRYRLGILGAALLFSTGGAAIKLCSLDGWQVASFRSGLAALTLAVLCPRALRGWSWRTLVVGCAHGATMLLFALGNKLTTAANAIFLQSTAPLYILVLAPFLLRERARRSDLGLMAAIAVGLALFFIELDPTTASAPEPFLGNVLGAASGVTWALTLLGLRWLAHTRTDHTTTGADHSVAAVIVGNGLACLVALPAALPLAGGTGTDWLTLGYLGVVQIALAYLLLTYGLRRVPAFEGSLLILIEPTLNPLWAWLLQGEVPGAWALVGGAIILGSTIVKSWTERRRSEPPDGPFTSRAPP
ncbi:MAG: DMT family transporter [Deltaproteobacteria bacterium]|nr:DMT family transporter [Deltaproteobacteria bacterium]